MFVCRVLVADDDRDICSMVALFLTGAGCAVQTAFDGRAALRAIEASRPDVVLCDLRMPLNGHALIQVLRERALDIELVVMTAADEAEGLEEGVADNQYLRKPFNLHDLLAAVRRSCARAAPRDEARGCVPGNR